MPTIHGTDNSETIDGSNIFDTIFGYGGHDTIYGLGGHDSIFGGNGNDEIRGGSGNDAIEGGAGADDIFGGSSDSGDQRHLPELGYGCHRKPAHRHGSRWRRRGRYADRHRESPGSDVQRCPQSAIATSNDLGGRTGNDTLRGGGGADDLFGQNAGIDTLKGGGGADVPGRWP